MSLVVGLTGLPGAGKGTAARILERDYGVRILDVDRIGHVILEEASIRAAVVRHFGTTILGANQAIDRAALARRVFGNPAELAALEAIVHPPMIQRVREEVAEGKQRGPVVIDAALLYPMGLHTLCDGVWIVEADRRLRLSRLLARGWDEAELARREERLQTVRALFPPPWQILKNEGSLAEWEATIRRKWEEMSEAMGIPGGSSPSSCQGRK